MSGSEISKSTLHFFEISAVVFLNFLAGKKFLGKFEVPTNKSWLFKDDYSEKSMKNLQSGFLYYSNKLSKNFDWNVSTFLLVL
jgi:hypothetical protein